MRIRAIAPVSRAGPDACRRLQRRGEASDLAIRPGLRDDHLRRPVGVEVRFVHEACHSGVATNLYRDEIVAGRIALRSRVERRNRNEWLVVAVYTCTSCVLSPLTVLRNENDRSQARQAYETPAPAWK